MADSGAERRIASTETDRTISPAAMTDAALLAPWERSEFPKSSNPPPIAAWTVAFGRYERITNDLSFKSKLVRMRQDETAIERHNSEQRRSRKAGRK